MKTQGNKKHCINHSKHDIMIDFYAQKINTSRNKNIIHLA